NTNQIIFSSNRNNDTTNTRVKGYKTLPVNYNLFLYDLDSSNNIVQRITNTVSKDIRPIAKDEDNYYYLSDQRGIMNLFRFTRSTGIYSQITNFNSSIEEYDLNFYSRKMTMVTDKDLSTDIFLLNNFNYDRQVFTPSTRRKEVQMARAITEKRKTEENLGMTIKELLNSRLRAKSDTITINTGDTTKRQEPPAKPTLKE